MRWLVLVVAMAHAAVAAPARTCKPGGGELFEVAQRAVRGALLVSATTWLYRNGAWRTEVFDIDGTIARTRSGCLKRSQLEILRRELARAPWKTAHVDRPCRTDQPRFTRYRWKGRLVYTERTCNAVVLDSASRHALDLVAFYVPVPSNLDGDGAPTRRVLPLRCLADPLAPGCK